VRLLAVTLTLVYRFAKLIRALAVRILQPTVVQIVDVVGLILQLPY
jgi:hypothetical protein